MPDPITTPVVPPPTTEVTVRTLESDLAAIAASGGTVSTLSAPQGVSVVQPHPVQAGPASHVVSSLLGWLAVIIALGAFAGLGWLGYRYFNAEEAPLAQEPGSSLPTAPITSTGPLASLPQTVSTHKSLLSRPVGDTVTFPLIAPSGTLKTRFQLMREGLDKVPASSRVALLVPTDAAGKVLSFPGYATTIGAPDLIDRDTYEKYIENDFTLLGVRGQGGFAAAYIFSLKPNGVWLYAEPGVRALEISPSVANLFLQIPGTQTSGFIDGTVAEQPVRTSSYANPAGVVTYGFFRDRLIIATSRQALDEALKLLCFSPGSC